MRIETIGINNNHWSTDWIPISYKNALNRNQIKKSLSFIWSIENTLFAICRAYYIRATTIEIGDVWLNEKYRGAKINGDNVSIIFMKKVINKIWKAYPDANKINLIVHKDNIAAIKLYEKLKFTLIGNAYDNKLSVKNHLLMARLKRIF